MGTPFGQVSRGVYYYDIKKGRGPHLQADKSTDQWHPSNPGIDQEANSTRTATTMGTERGAKTALSVTCLPSPRPPRHPQMPSHSITITHGLFIKHKNRPLAFRRFRTSDTRNSGSAVISCA